MQIPPRVIVAVLLIIVGLLVVVIIVGLLRDQVDSNGLALVLTALITGIVGGGALRSNNRDKDHEA